MTPARERRGIREVERADLPGLIELIHDHAAFERAPRPTTTLPALERLLFEPSPRLYGFVALADGQLIGYATCSREASTWAAGEYLHLDCLYLRPEARGRGVGQRLVDAAVDLAAAQGLGELQWQTPEWNVDAIRFYDRLDAASSGKRRYRLDVRQRGAGVD
ncbi:GNAT family N-acetyltransferase [Agromyces sp. G08B096]|uniref:GNAT family N-acetyltransferase n=1 Tax=Agromyces sp. G08B096 TaxID=3156399 RepID=A0AAU7W9I5_9MICO